MSKLTHIQKLKLDGCDGIVLLRGQTLFGDEIFAYIRASREDIDRMIIMCEAGEAIDYSKYKEIIKNDWGSPCDNVKRFMESEYGFRHGDEDNIRFP